jgi:transposase
MPRMSAGLCPLKDEWLARRAVLLLTICAQCLKTTTAVPWGERRDQSSVRPVTHNPLDNRERSGMARRARDGKQRELAASRTLNPRPEGVVDEAFRFSEFFDARDLVQVKYEMVRRVEADGCSVSAAAGAFGFSRQSYYSAARALADEGLAGLVPAKPGPRGAHKLTDKVLEHLEGLREADPGLGPAELAAAVAERFGVTVHRRSVKRALARREAAKRGPKSG